MDSDEELALQIRQIRNNIREKFGKLKSKQNENDRTLENRYKSIIKPINTLSNSLLSEMLSRDNDTNANVDEKMGIKKEEEEEEEDVKVDQNDQIVSLVDEYTSLAAHPLAQKVMDVSFGLKFNRDEGWKMGNYSVSFDNDRIYIGTTPFDLTKGLLDLLFLREPKNYTEKDLNTYKSILELSNAHKMGSGRLKSNKGIKYKKIISKLFPTKTKEKSAHPMDIDHELSGTGFQMQYEKGKSNVQYVYFDDPNELCVRLKKLIASSQAGNNSHTNEIISILEELAELGIIKAPIFSKL